MRRDESLFQPCPESPSPLVQGTFDTIRDALLETEDVTFEAALSSGEGKLERAEKYHVLADGPQIHRYLTRYR